MPSHVETLPARVQHTLRRTLRSVGLFLVPFLLAVALIAGGSVTTLAVALALPLTMMALFQRRASAAPFKPDALTGLEQRESLVAALEAALTATEDGHRNTGAMVLEVDRFKLIEERHDRAAVERILKLTAERLRDCLRENDVAGRLDGPTFAIALSPVRRLDLEAAIQMAGRVQRALTEPISIDGTKANITTSIGFALASRLDAPTGDRLLQAATLAMIEAQRSGPGAIRSYSTALSTRIHTRNSLADEVVAALDKGEISAFFQPQISTRTGRITGFEALARWHHPERGLIPPGEFIPALQQAGLMNRLGEVMVQDGLTALRGWDDAGLSVPQVAVNFSHDELCDPKLVDRIAWELDRFGLSPDRMVIEVLETVVADRNDDMVIRNLSGLAKLGCCLDLDDFGTGHAAITSIRRFSIQRIKIDRSFITRIDRDKEQQDMVSAILTMADRLGLDTLAEGVETAEEHAMLGKLGCGHVQGFGIARPMPASEAVTWIRARKNDAAAVTLMPRRAI